MGDVTSPDAISATARVSWKWKCSLPPALRRHPIWAEFFLVSWGSTGGDQPMLFGVSLSFFPLRCNWNYRGRSPDASLLGYGALTCTSTVASESMSAEYSDSPRIYQLVCTQSWCGTCERLLYSFIRMLATSCTCSCFLSVLICIDLHASGCFKACRARCDLLGNSY